MLPVPLHPDMCQSVMPIAAMCHSVLIHTTLKFPEPLCATHAAMRLSVLLLQDLGYVPRRDIKICPTNTEELILNSKTMDEHVRGRNTLKLILLCTPPHHIRHLNYGTKNWYRLIKTARETTSIDKRTSFSSSKTVRTWLMPKGL